MESMNNSTQSLDQAMQSQAAEAVAEETVETNQPDTLTEVSAPAEGDDVEDATTTDEPQPTENAKPGVEEILRAVITDDRVGHFIVDVLTGRNVIESISERFNISGVKQAVVDALVDEAEERGYLRGRNEQIETKMAEPGMWQSQQSTTAREEAGSGERNPFLRRVRRSVWD